MTRHCQFSIRNWASDARTAFRYEGFTPDPTMNVSESALNAAIDAYLYGYPLAVIDITRTQATNVPAAEQARVPMGQLLHFGAIEPSMTIRFPLLTPIRSIRMRGSTCRKSPWF